MVKLRGGPGCDRPATVGEDEAEDEESREFTGGGNGDGESLEGETPTEIWLKTVLGGWDWLELIGDEAVDGDCDESRLESWLSADFVLGLGFRVREAEPEDDDDDDDSELDISGDEDDDDEAEDNIDKDEEEEDWLVWFSVSRSID